LIYGELTALNDIGKNKTLSYHYNNKFYNIRYLTNKLLLQHIFKNDYKMIINIFEKEYQNKIVLYNNLFE